ncbi:MAG: sigma-70 family RNA polymerase sigma factor [Planctomycetota bacterium]
MAAANGLAWRAGERQQRLTAWLAAHGPVVRGRIDGRIPARWRAVLSVDDVMQQTYTDAFVDFDQLVSSDEVVFEAWLATIAERNLIDALRMLEAEKRGARGHPIQPLTRNESLTALYGVLASSSSTPSRNLGRKEACAALASAIEQLPEAYRQVVQKHDLEGVPIKTVAEALQRSPGAVCMMRARAHRRLQALLGRASDY